MKILLVNSAWPQSWGGGEKWFVDAAVWFREHGHDVALVARPDSMLLSRARHKGLKTFSTKFGGDYDPFAVWRAKKIIKAFQPHIITVNFNKEARQFGKAAKSLGIPVVARHGFPLFHHGIRHRTLKNNLLTKLIVNAESIKEQYRALGLNVDDVSVVLNGARIPEQRRGELRKRFNIPETAPLIVAAGRLEPQKRMDRVIDIVSELRDQFSDLRCLILGTGPAQDELKTLILSRHLESTITLGGFVENLDVMLGDADVFLLMSDEEGTPNILLEAMASGVPSVAFSVGSVPQILGEELSRFAIPPGNLHKMKKQVLCLLTDDTARKSWGEKMKQSIAEKFSFDHSMEHYEEIFAELIAQDQ